jgi:hypothetical protein
MSHPNFNRRLAARVSLTLLALATIGGMLLWANLKRVEMWIVGYHQKAITKELEEWGQQYSIITNMDSAIQSARMVSYMDWYYRPGPGYEGPAQIQKALEAQRKDSISLVVTALDNFTGLNYGANVQKWGNWAENESEQQSKP